MPAVADRVKETTTTIGTGTLNLDGPVSKFQSFVTGIGTGNQCYYAIVHQSAAEWEVGIGTVTDAAPDTLSRTTVLASSNAGALVSLSAGTKDVFATIPAANILTTMRYVNFARDATLTSGTQVVAHGGSKTPKGAIFFTQGGTNQTSSHGIWTLSPASNVCLFTTGPANTLWGRTMTESISDRQNSVTDMYQGNVSAADATNITITWTKTGSPTGEINVLALLFF